MIAWRPAAAAMDQERFEVRPLIVGHQSANQGCPPQRAALNQFAILASIGLSTRPSPVFREFQQVERDYPPNGFDYDRDYEQIAERFERIRALAIAAGSIAVQT